MNTIAGSQWFSPLAFARFAQYAHPRFVEADGSRPTLHTGRFSHTELLSVYKGDYSDGEPVPFGRSVFICSVLSDHPSVLSSPQLAGGGRLRGGVTVRGPRR